MDASTDSVDLSRAQRDLAVAQRDLGRADLMAREALTAMLFGGPREPERVGRYRIIGVLGEGGMGVVFHAHDDELARPVALKVLHEQRGGGSSSARARLLREAQAMAQLSHPNVVQVHDVGEHDGQVFLAMELIRGETLRAWVESLGEPAARCKRWREIVAMFVQAGRGLAAAHDATLIHRDFKPANALVGEDGRARVLDFGLARARGSSADVEREEQEAGDDALAPATDTAPRSVRDATAQAPADHDADAGREAASAPSLTTTMTVAGSILGTPAYISPEQLAGARAGPASDQFSFCVSLHEALLGARPFTGDSLRELQENMSSGTFSKVPAGVAIPGWLAAAIERGLALDPAARWPSMHALIDALLDDPAIRRRNRRIAGGLALLAGATALGAWASERRAQARCEATGDAVHGDWSADARARIEAAFTGTELEYAADTFARAARGLDAWTSSWRDARAGACHDARRGDADDKLRETCLDRQRWQLASTLAVLGEADAAIVARAVPMIAALPRPAACDEPGGLAAAAAAAESEASPAALDRVRQQLALVTVDDRAGRYDEALARATAARGEAERLGDDVLTAEALATLGAAQSQRGAHADAETTLRAAFFLASGIGHDPVVAEAGERLVRVVGYHEGRAEDGLEWADHVRAANRRMGAEPSPRFLESLGYVQVTTADTRGAAESFERALELRARLYGPEHPGLAEPLSDLGTVHQMNGDYDRAAASMQRALEISERALGANHPELALYLCNLGVVARERGRLEEAETYYRRARELQERALGPEHPDLATTLSVLGRVLRDRGALAEAHELHARALAISLAQPGEHPDTAAFRTYLGATLERMGRVDEALAQHEQSLAQRERLLGPEHPEVVESLNNLGVALERLGRYDEALAYYQRALAIAERAYGPEHVNLAPTLDNVGIALTELGRAGEALELLRRALAIREAALAPDHLDMAGSRDHIGVALLREGAASEALASHRRALELRLATRGPEHELTGKTHRRLSAALLATGAPAEALQHGERALEIATASRARADDERARCLIAIGRALTELSRADEAAARLERAIELARGPALDPKISADARFALARARPRAPDAVEHARAAARIYGGLGARAAAERERVAAWRDEQPN